MAQAYDSDCSWALFWRFSKYAPLGGDLRTGRDVMGPPEEEPEVLIGWMACLSNLIIDKWGRKRFGWRLFAI